MTGFDKRVESFPIKRRHVFLSSCVVSPLHRSGLHRLIELSQCQAESGALLLASYDEILDRLRGTAAQLLRTSPENVSFQRNTAEAMSLIAAGYPFERGDQVIGYVHEYPSNHYPWRSLERRGVELIQLANVTPPGNEACGDRPCAFSLDELAERITDRTRIVALSHVQFASGFALDLDAVATLCRERGVDLVLDVAQSLGSLPFYPEELGVAAAASPAWKWLLGPLGCGLMYTSAEFRGKLDLVLLGAGVMQQGTDYFDHTWAPHESARRFEYSTGSLALAAGLEACIAEVHLRYGVEALRAEIFRLQDLLLGLLDGALFAPAVFAPPHRSGILSLVCRRRAPVDVAEALLAEGFVVSARGGYVRIAPHFYVTEDEVVRVAEALNRLGA